MKKIILIFLTFYFGFCSFAQIAKKKSFDIGLSVPIIKNKSEGIYYSLGSKKKPKGSAYSYGINANFSKTVYKNWFVFFGIGYFNQVFNIGRPFDFNGDIITNLLYYTKTYKFKNVKIETGLGYKFSLSDKVIFNILGTYNFLYSFRQKYIPSRLSGNEYKPLQKNNIQMPIGNITNINFGIEKKVYKKNSICFDLILPIITKWGNDKTFTNYIFADDSQKIGITKSSVGVNFTFKHHF